jgi:hypothetical protein
MPLQMARAEQTGCEPWGLRAPKLLSNSKPDLFFAQINVLSKTANLDGTILFVGREAVVCVGESKTVSHGAARPRKDLHGTQLPAGITTETAYFLY